MFVGTALVAAAVLACLYGSISLAWSPYTDQQIRSSIVDTWEPEATVTSVFLGALLVCLALCVWLGIRSRKPTDRVLSALASALTLAGMGLVLASHAALTIRVTRLTGQTFGTFYGLL
jgi:hypothetical protein